MFASRSRGGTRAAEATEAFPPISLTRNSLVNGAELCTCLQAIQGFGISPAPECHLGSVQPVLVQATSAANTFRPGDEVKVLSCRRRTFAGLNDQERGLLCRPVFSLRSVCSQPTHRTLPVFVLLCADSQPSATSRLWKPVSMETRKKNLSTQRRRANSRLSISDAGPAID
ncbi:unnamed protein product [Pleuronectes platessa]|uniref:Uncharacterized protein n=1 Tax=Pleuronectes platessa TaxID=8262 RepID=A0A9N7YJZ0_PLEPL|nr:unnamed protein product [Pleuronectes platessa]